jgi:hypothetical protein
LLGFFFWFITRLAQLVIAILTIITSATCIPTSEVGERAFFDKVTSFSV